jgi:hypothetical protein
MIGSLPTSQTAVGTRPASDPTSGTSGLAHAFDRAHHNTGCGERRHAGASATASADNVSELAGAVRDFVTAGRADGSPPERILATIKRVTRPCLFDGADEARGDRLQTLILREFLTSYYDVEAAATPVPTASE